MSVGQGTEDSVRHIFLGIVISTIINTLGTTLLSANYAIYFSIINALIAILLIFTLTKMGYAYLTGWMLGIGLLIYGGALNTGLITIPELALDIAIPVVAIVLKLFILQNNKSY